MVHLTVALGLTATSGRCVALRCAAPPLGTAAPVEYCAREDALTGTNALRRLSLQEELQLTSRLRKELAELRATGVSYE